MVQQETDRVKRQIKLGDIKCSRDFKKNEKRSKKNTIMNTEMLLQ